MDEAALRARLSTMIRERGVRPLAREVGVSDVALHRWMSGQSTLAWGTVQRVAEALGCEAGRETVYKLRPRSSKGEAA